MKIVLEVSDGVITKCKSVDEICGLFANELARTNQAVYQHIFNLGINQGWIEAEKQFERYPLHCPSCDGHRCDDY